MAIPDAAVYLTYDLGGASGVGKINREDLISSIYNVDPDETPFFSDIATKVKATATLHSWNTDTLAAVKTSTGVEIEGNDTALDAQVLPVRVANTTALLSWVFTVSGTQQAVSTVEGAGKEVARQLMKSGMNLRRSIETNLLENNAGAVGSEGTGRETAGIETWLVTNTSATGTNATGIGTNARTIATGTNIRAFTESQLKAVLNLVYASGGDPTTIMTKPFNKQVLSSFAGNSTRIDKAEDSKLHTAVDVYVSDFGDLKVIPNRFQNPTGTTVNTVYVLDPEYWAVAELLPIVEKPLAEAGLYTKRGFYWEGALEARNEKASGAVFDLSVS